MDDDENGAPEPPVERADDYEVGYKKPPKRTQFQPGCSGNYSGRPKASENSERPDAVFLRRLGETMKTATKKGKTRRAPKFEVICDDVIDKAAAGDSQAQRAVFAFLARCKFPPERKPFTFIIEN